ncbi:MAG: ribonuclease T2 family protein [Caulobacterales bacterium]|jgi:ribonuclease T2
MGAIFLAIAVAGLAGCGQGAAPASQADVEAWGGGYNQAKTEAGAEGQTAPAQAGSDGAGAFDYYLLALSWSPSFCAQDGMSERETLQCGGARPYAFVVHGLWPQNERGWPEACATDQPADASDAIVEQMLDLMPSPGLIQHEWDKHGTCSGLSPEAYFNETRSFRQKVRIPAAYTQLERPLQVSASALEDAFVQANRGLTADAINVTCSRGRLREVRICFDRQGDFRACGGDVRDRCGDEPLTMLPVRGQ